MLFPKGAAVYENLNTSFTQLDAMMAELKGNQFSGYVQLTSWEYEGILLMDTGNMINAVEETKGQRRHGASAAESISAKGREKDGTISVYRLSTEMTQLLANSFNSEPIYKDLSSDLTGLDKLAAKMQKEKLTGYIEVRMSKSGNTATIYMREGKVLDSTFADHGNVTSGAKVFDDVILASAMEPSVFTVYRADLTAIYGDGINLSDSFARQGMLTFWQEILKSFESATDAGAKAGTFVTTFKRASIDLASQYPFLDPFAAEFEYKDGKIKFDGQATVAQFNEGMSRCIAQAVRDLIAQASVKDLSNKLGTVVRTLGEKYAARIQEVGLSTALPEFFAK